MRATGVCVGGTGDGLGAVWSVGRIGVCVTTGKAGAAQAVTRINRRKREISGEDIFLIIDTPI
jgi:hypothetical protein